MRSIPCLFLGALLAGCAPLTTTTTVTAPSGTYTCSGDTGCCCNSPIQHANPAAGRWPDCAAGYECVAMQPGGVVHPNPAVGRIDVNLCRSRLAARLAGHHTADRIDTAGLLPDGSLALSRRACPNKRGAVQSGP